MPVISFANPKGGSGKTTLAMVLALELSNQGVPVGVIDADPNAIIAKWATRRREEGKPLPFEVVERPREADMVSTITEMSKVLQFVLVDLEGTASRMMSRAFSRSNLVLVPLNPSPVDAGLAAEAVRLVNEESETLQREIPYRLVYSRNNAAIATKSFKRISSAIAAADLPTLSAGLVERAAYRDIFDFARTLEELTPAETSGLGQAKENAFAVAQAVVDVLKEISDPAAKAEQQQTSEPASEAVPT
jgi:chromosome partitioning protein